METLTEDQTVEIEMKNVSVIYPIEFPEEFLPAVFAPMVAPNSYLDKPETCDRGTDH